METGKRLLFVMVGVLLIGIVYEQLGERGDRAKYPQIGRSVDIGGRTLNIFCSGDGSPTVIFEGAGHTAGFAWVDIQAEVAKFTHTCWYDRAGYGWSDSGPSPRTFKAIADDLHALLHTAMIPGPYVLVGATAGAFHVRVYNGLYPADVVGAVLIHGADPDIFAHEPRYMKGPLDSLPHFMKRLGCSVIAPSMVQIGLLRLMGNPGAGRPYGAAHLTEEQQQELNFLSNNPRTAQTEGEGCVLDESMAEVRAAGDFGSRPLYVLVSARPFHAPTPQYREATEALNEYWFHTLQPHLAALSNRGHLIVKDKAEEPDSVIRAVRRVVEEVRGNVP